jgi:hypothetical protein
MELYGGSGGIALCILNLSTSWEWVVSFTPWPFNCQEAGLDAVADKIPAPAGNETLVIQPVA